MTEKKTAPAPTASPEAVADLREAQAKEWGQFVAVQPITFNGANAYNVGDPVPASSVERYGYLKDGLVRSADDAKEAVVASLEAPAEVPPPVSLNVQL